MKKLLFVISICALGLTSSLYAAKDEVSEKDVQKVVNKAPKANAKWADMKLVSEADVQNSGWAFKDGNEIVSQKDGATLVIKNLGGQCSMMFEFTAAEDAEGFVFVRAPKGNISKAVKIKLAGKNTDKGETSIGSIDDVLKAKEGIEEPKGRMITIKVFVEGDSIRVSKANRINSNYADRNFLRQSLDEVAQKRGSEVAPDGSCGFVATKGELKLKNLYITQF